MTCVLPGCSGFTSRRMQGVVAECDGEFLTERDLRVITKGLSSMDSVRAVEQYIRQWCINIQMEHAISGVGYRVSGNGHRVTIVDDRSEEIERMVADYRRSLYEHEWERHLVAREMSQQVVDSVVIAYYEQYGDKFKLRETILRGVLLVVPTGAPGLDKIKKQLLKLSNIASGESNEEVVEILEQLEKYAYQYGSGYELFLDEWKTANQVLSRMPFEEDNLHKLLKQKRQLSLQDSLNTYVLQVSEMYLRGEEMPLDYARSEIEKIILAQRQVEFIQMKREELYNEAIKKGNLKIYEK